MGGAYFKRPVFGARDDFHDVTSFSSAAGVWWLLMAARAFRTLADDWTG
jgi:hypothetical protein